MPDKTSIRGEFPVTKPKAILPTVILLSVVIAVLWVFPRFWYSRTDPGQGYFWLSEQDRLPGWTYKEAPISEAAESVLAADKIVNGAFRDEGGTIVRVFSAKRYEEKESEFDMFSHTPDRCWTSVGWKLQPVEPESVGVNLHGVTLRLERRIFTVGAQRELVYFGALVGGQPLPYRLDQYLDIGARRTEKSPGGIFGKMIGALDARFFGWPWKSFASRRPLMGPKQFIRISTPLSGSDTRAADALLAQFLPQWLALTDYHRELEQWHRK